jgi:hypothetical protein
LVARYGIDAKINEFSNEVTADCRRKMANDPRDPCAAIRPDLPKVL